MQCHQTIKYIYQVHFCSCLASFIICWKLYLNSILGIMFFCTIRILANNLINVLYLVIKLISILLIVYGLISLLSDTKEALQYCKFQKQNNTNQYQTKLTTRDLFGSKKLFLSLCLNWHKIITGIILFWLI